MQCSCIENKQFDFILDYEKDHLVFTDKSKWVTAKNAEPITEFEVTISIYDTYSTSFNARVNGETKIPYTSLPTTDNSICDYDGIYKFSVNVCDDIMYKYNVILKNIHCAYSKLVLKEDWKNAIEVFYQMELIKSHALVRNFQSAEKQYALLESFLVKLNCNCN
jgi:hypothetical protein